MAETDESARSPAAKVPKHEMAQAQNDSSESIAETTPVSLNLTQSEDDSDCEAYSEFFFQANSSIVRAESESDNGRDIRQVIEDALRGGPDETEPAREKSDFSEYLAAMRKEFEDELRCGPEGSRPAIFFDGMCFVINVEINEEMIQTLVEKLTNYGIEDEDEGKAEIAKKELIELLTVGEQENPAIASLIATDHTPEQVEDCGVFRVRSDNTEATYDWLAQLICVDLNGSAKIPGVMLGDELFVMCSAPTDDNIMALAKAVANFIAAKEVPDHPWPESIDNLRQSLRDKLVPIEDSLDLDMEIVHSFGAAEDNGTPFITVFRCSVKKQDVEESKEESNEDEEVDEKKNDEKPNWAI